MPRPSSRNQLLWLARGAALGSFLRWLLRAMRAVAGELRHIGRVSGRVPTSS
jgi:fluoride ion exporter CrcB/FEX